MIMAEIITSSNSRKNIGTRSKKKDLRVDLTAMVDLGFVLITFFIFTTTMAEMKAMKLFLPKGEEKINKIPASDALTLIAHSNDEVFYFRGELMGNGDNLYKTNQEELSNLLAGFVSHPSHDLNVIIHSTPDANFGNIVDMLDEMTIHQIKRYALADIEASLLALIK